MDSCKHSIFHVAPYKIGSCIAYEITGLEEDMWLSFVGCISDWHVPFFIDKKRI